MQVFQYLHLVCVSETASEKNIYVTIWWFYCLNLSGQSFCYSDFVTLLQAVNSLTKWVYWERWQTFKLQGKSIIWEESAFPPETMPNMWTAKTITLVISGSPINSIAQSHFWNITSLSKSLGSYISWNELIMSSLPSVRFCEWRAELGLRFQCGQRLAV